MVGKVGVNIVRRVVVFLILSVYCAAASGCGPAANDSAAETAAVIGCDFDSVKVCTQALSHPIDFSTGIDTSNQSYLEQNEPMTAWEQVPVKAPGGSEIDVQCEINTQNRIVVYAFPKPSGAISESDRAWLRQVGYCSGEAGTTAPPKVRAEN